MSAVEISGVSLRSVGAELELMEEQAHHSEIAEGKTDVKQESAMREVAQEDQQHAQEKAAEEAKKSSFWSDVSTVAKDVAVGGSIAAAAFTGGSSLVVAATIVGGGLTVGGDVAKKMGASDAVCRDMEIAGAGTMLLAGGVGFFASGTGTTTTASMLGKVAGSSVAGGGTATAGLATIEKGRHDANVSDANADAAQSGADADEAKNRSDMVLSHMEHQMQSRIETQHLVQKLEQTLLSADDVVMQRSFRG